MRISKRAGGCCIVTCALSAFLWQGAAFAAVTARLVTSAVTAPTYIASAGDGRLFVVEQAGRVLVLQPPLGNTAPSTFLDLRSKVASGGERGLLSLAFHPDYAQNGFVYVDYTNLAGDTVIERYQRSADPNQADANSAVTLLVIDQPFSNHNGGQLQIGPRDGFLYIGMGDGGSSGDPNCRAQTTSNGELLGKLLRIDVRQNQQQAPFYGIPSSNPFNAARDPQGLVADEVWAIGLRNPWRFSFDRATGDLFIADVGQDQIEEVDLEPAGAAGGRNYGWKVMEGTQCFSNASCPAGTAACNDPSLTLPIFQYTHASGCSITGGYVYRGTRAAELSGAYVYADYCSGAVRTLRRNAGGQWQSSALLSLGASPTSFGEGSSGELYVAAGNQIFELASSSPPSAPLLGRFPGALALGLGAIGVAITRWRRGARRAGTRLAAQHLRDEKARD